MKISNHFEHLQQEYLELKQNHEILKQKDKHLEIINDFAIYMLNKNTIDDIVWAIAKKVIAKMNFVDCVVYLLDKEKQILIQKAAHGPKNPIHLEIKNPITIPLGQGIVGSVALYKKAEIVADTSLDSRYILDDNMRFSEIAVPIIYEDMVLGVIDSEHPEKNYYTKEHQTILTTIAATKIMHAYTLQSLQEHKNNLEKEVAEKTKALRNSVAELKRSNTDLEQFAYAASHDLKSPLRTIVSFMQLLERREKNISDRSKNYIRLAINGATRMQNLVNGLLNYSRVSGDKTALELVDIEEIICVIKSNLSATIKETKTIINISQLPKVFGNSTQLMQLFQNLISNAIKFRHENTSPIIDIDVVMKGNFAVFSVQDNGIGIAKSDISKVFLLFKKLHSKEEYQGSGIGLALCQRIIKKHKGIIYIESNVERGTCFKFNLPINAICYE